MKIPIDLKIKIFYNPIEEAWRAESKREEYFLSCWGNTPEVALSNLLFRIGYYENSN